MSEGLKQHKSTSLLEQSLRKTVATTTIDEADSHLNTVEPKGCKNLAENDPSEIVKVEATETSIVGSDEDNMHRSVAGLEDKECTNESHTKIDNGIGVV